MMKFGEAISRQLTWLTLSGDLPTWEVSLQVLFNEADAALDDVE